ncbi:MAG TPA: protease complex subunit PrcB family protein [Chthonomonadales bacterium]|nr:protease complex subunit PrcB family protein [Chthonomonadales bacterium]
MIARRRVGLIAILCLCTAVRAGADLSVETAPQEDIAMTYSEESASAPKLPAAQPEQTGEKPFSLSGQRSSILKPRQVVVRDVKAFAALWKEHTAGVTVPASLPKVDFKKFDVVAVFLGSKPTGGYSVEIGDVRRDRKGATIPVTIHKPGPGSIVTQAFTYPFAMRAVPKLPKAVKFAITEKARGEE